MKVLRVFVFMAAVFAPVATPLYADDAVAVQAAKDAIQLNQAAANGGSATEHCESPAPAVLPPARLTERVIYQASIPFKMGDDNLCFENYGFKDGPWPLDKLASKYGACQGMVGITRGFRHFATFTCQGEKPNHAQSITILDRVMELQAKDDASNPIRINGYCSLREFCQANQSLFRREAVSYNTDLTLQSTVGHVIELKRGATAAAQVENLTTISTLYNELQEGRAPLMLYPFHVVMVTGITITQNFTPDTKEYQVDHYTVKIDYYDPNDGSTMQSRVLTVGKDFKGTVKEEPIFVVDP